MVDESQAMRRALDLAVQGWGRVAPNPMVGAVLLRNGQIIGEGHHAEFGGPHAEVAAIAATDAAAGATCVVTLEPCAHQGKTPPCTNALIEAGRVRFRPILMTAATTVVGLIPMALTESGQSQVSYKALALVVMGGLTVSTFFTLFFVPILFTLMDDLRILTRQIVRGIIPGGDRRSVTPDQV